MPKQSALEGNTESPEPMLLTEAMKFLVRLSNIGDELGTKDPGVLPSIVHGFRRYLLAPAGGQAARQLDLIEESGDPTRLLEHSEAVSSLLNAVAKVSDAGLLKGSTEERRQRRESAARIELEKTAFKPREPITAKLVYRNGKIRCHREGSLQDILMDTAIDDFDDESIDLLRIGRCHLASCGKLLYKVKLNQTYCDHRCANKAAALRRAKPGAKVKSRLSSKSARQGKVRQ